MRPRGVRISPRTSLTVLGVTVAAAAGAVVLAFGPVGADDATPATTTTTVRATTTTERPTTTTAAPTTTTTVRTTTTTAPATPPAADGSLKRGASGPEVLELQQRLNAIGFWLGPPDGSYDRLTEQAVMAFQKANGLGRDGNAGPATLAALATATRPTPRSTADGVEIDLARQLLFVVRGGQVTEVINTSTGKKGMSTPPGDFVVDRQVDGIRHAPLGDLYRPKYFNEGIAVHGSPSIPGYPASHGCARVSNPAMDHLWASGALAVGTPVRVH